MKEARLPQAAYPRRHGMSHPNKPKPLVMAEAEVLGCRQQDLEARLRISWRWNSFLLQFCSFYMPVLEGQRGGSVNKDADC